MADRNPRDKSFGPGGAPPKDAKPKKKKEEEGPDLPEGVDVVEVDGEKFLIQQPQPQTSTSTVLIPPIIQAAMRQQIEQRNRMANFGLDNLEQAQQRVDEFSMPTFTPEEQQANNMVRELVGSGQLGMGADIAGSIAQGGLGINTPLQGLLGSAMQSDPFSPLSGQGLLGVNALGQFAQGNFDFDPGGLMAQQPQQPQQGGVSLADLAPFNITADDLAVGVPPNMTGRPQTVQDIIGSMPPPAGTQPQMMVPGEHQPLPEIIQQPPPPGSTPPVDLGPLAPQQTIHSFPAGPNVPDASMVPGNGPIGGPGPQIGPAIPMRPPGPEVITRAMRRRIRDIPLRDSDKRRA